MKCAQWKPCSEISIASEILNLQEVGANLMEFPASPTEMVTAGRVSLALSFIQQAMDALSQARSSESSPKI
jgi:hypothetical protein